ncbi:MAG: response regulator [Desulfobacterales bacterium]|nr:MAG: response regulator [Desulfobacterales bacterium]
MPKKALVVDNNYFFVEFLSELLEKRGYSVTKAYNGKEGLSKLENGPVDIIFADLIMPKVDVRQFIQFIRMKYQENQFPIVALSGTVIEQMSELDEIGADYYIPKGPIDKLTIQLNEFMAEIENQPFFPSTKKKILKNGPIFPRREAMELLNTLQFHRAIIENIGVGVIVVDKDVRVLNANSLALDIVQKSAVDVLNCRIDDLFPSKQRAELKDALKRVTQEPEIKKITFYTSFNHQITRTIVTPIVLQNNTAGWVVALEDADSITNSKNG